MSHSSSPVPRSISAAVADPTLALLTGGGVARSRRLGRTPRLLGPLGRQHRRAYQSRRAGHHSAGRNHPRDIALQALSDLGGPGESRGQPQGAQGPRSNRYRGRRDISRGESPVPGAGRACRLRPRNHRQRHLRHRLHHLGYDSAVNTALEAIDRIRDTAFSHERIFFVEVMGREAGILALEVGIAGGAEEVFAPEKAADLEAFCRSIRDAFDRGKRGFIVVVAEGDELGGAQRIADAVRKDLNLESRVSVLGHIQRAGSPTARDRVLASRLGVAAVDAILGGVDRIMVGVRVGEVFRHLWMKCSAEQKT